MGRIRFIDPAGSIRVGEFDGTTVSFGGNKYTEADVKVLPPVEPTKIIAVGRNYADHVLEREGRTEADIPDIPRLFFKTANTVAGHKDTITVPEGKERIEPEAELGVVIGKQCRNVSESDVSDVIDGYTCLNDLSNRDDQKNTEKTGRADYVRGKSFDNSAPIGPVVADPSDVPDDATIECRINGELTQQTTLNKMIFKIPEIIESVTKVITLEQGDIIATGTCEGPVPVSDGDQVNISIEGIGELENTIRFP